MIPLSFDGSDNFAAHVEGSSVLAEPDGESPCEVAMYVPEITHRWRLKVRCVLPMMLGALCPLAFLMIPFNYACGSAGKGYWQYCLSAWVHRGVFENLSLTFIYVGFCPVPGARVIAVVTMIVATTVYPTLFFLISHGYTHIDLEFWTNSGGAVITQIIIALVYGLGLLCCWCLDLRRGIRVQRGLSRALSTLPTAYGEMRRRTVRDLYVPVSDVTRARRQKVPMVLRSLRTQFLFTTGTLAVTGMVLFPCLVHMLKLAQEKQHLNLGFVALYFLASIVFKDVLKFLYFILDCGKQGNWFSGYYLSEIISSVIYFMFYRAMFEHVHTWHEFAFLTFFHFVGEWVQHPLRALPYYYHSVRGICEHEVTLQPGALGITYDRDSGVINEVSAGQCRDLGIQGGWHIQSIDREPYGDNLLRVKIRGQSPYKVAFDKQRFHPLVKKIVYSVLLPAQPGVECHDWGCFVALDTSVRSYAMLFSMIIYCGGFTWLRFGYNKNALRPGADPIVMSEHDFSFLWQQWTLAFVLELVNLAAMEVYFRWLLGGGGALYRLAGLFESNLMLAYFTVCCGNMSTLIWPSFLASGFCEQ